MVEYIINYLIIGDKTENNEVENYYVSSTNNREEEDRNSLQLALNTILFSAV